MRFHIHLLNGREGSTCKLEVYYDLYATTDVWCDPLCSWQWAVGGVGVLMQNVP